jgi:hypothetical protein
MVNDEEFLRLYSFTCQLNDFNCYNHTYKYFDPAHPRKCYYDKRDSTISFNPPMGPGNIWVLVWIGVSIMSMSLLTCVLACMCYEKNNELGAVAIRDGPTL